MEQKMEQQEKRPNLLARIVRRIPDWLFITLMVALQVALFVGYKEILRG